MSDSNVKVRALAQQSPELDTAMVLNYLKQSYWAKDRDDAQILTGIQNSICFAAFQGNQQIGFARVVSDQAVFAYLADVFVLDEYQGHGVGKQLVHAVLTDRRFKTVSRFMLATQDAHQFYKALGFDPLSQQDQQSLMRLQQL